MSTIITPRQISKALFETTRLNPALELLREEKL